MAGIKFTYPQKMTGKFENQYLRVTVKCLEGNSTKSKVHSLVVGPFNGAWKKCKKDAETAIQ